MCIMGMTPCCFLFFFIVCCSSFFSCSHQGETKGHLSPQENKPRATPTRFRLARLAQNRLRAVSKVRGLCSSNTLQDPPFSCWCEKQQMRNGLTSRNTQLVVSFFFFSGTKAWVHVPRLIPSISRTSKFFLGEAPRDLSPLKRLATRLFVLGGDSPILFHHGSFQKPAVPLRF